MIQRLNKRSLARAVNILISQDRRLKMIVSKYGPHHSGNASKAFTHCYIILEQQVSRASAKMECLRKRCTAGCIPYQPTSETKNAAVLGKHGSVFCKNLSGLFVLLPQLSTAPHKGEQSKQTCPKEDQC
jgi:hypothetical protein